MNEKETPGKICDDSMEVKCGTCPQFVWKYKSKEGVNFGRCKHKSSPSSNAIVSENGLCTIHPRYTAYR